LFHSLLSVSRGIGLQIAKETLEVQNAAKIQVDIKIAKAL
jgi:hypothetical protein